MAVSASLYHTLCRELAAVAPAVRVTSRQRLAVFIVAIVASQSCVIAALARRLQTLGLSGATAESIGRRLRRAMNDPRLVPSTCYRPLIRQLLAHPGPVPVLIAIDESSHQEWVHVLQASLMYRGSGIPLCWVTWHQNTKQDRGAYWQAMDRLLEEVAACLPPTAQVIILADRLYGIPGVIDRIAVYRWQFVIRLTTTGSHRWCGRQGSPAAPRWGRDLPLTTVIQQALPQPGTRFRTSGRFAKKAGWRAVNLVGVWGNGQREALVVMTDLAPRWQVLAWYRRRFWTEARFRDDKRAGWQWEGTQVRDPAHHAMLLLAMAWATLLCLWQGAIVAAARVAATAGTRRKPSHARQSLANLGREALIAWVYGLHRPRARHRIPWVFPDLPGSAWTMAWSATLARHYIFASQPVRP